MTRVAAMASRLSLILLFALPACTERRADEPAAAAVDRDTLTRRQRDSITATLPIPGARGIAGALSASDAARARAAEHDAELAAP